MALRLPRLPRELVDKVFGAYAVQYQTFWQSFARAIEQQEATQDQILADLQAVQAAQQEQIEAILAAQEAAAAAQAAADEATAAAETASTAAAEALTAVDTVNTAIEDIEGRLEALENPPPP